VGGGRYGYGGASNSTLVGDDDADEGDGADDMVDANRTSVFHLFPFGEKSGTSLPPGNGVDCHFKLP
jgi:hypothetical protein